VALGSPLWQGASRVLGWVLGICVAGLGYGLVQRASRRDFCARVVVGVYLGTAMHATGSLVVPIVIQTVYRSAAW
jgi:hypothetical protein